MKKFSFLIFFIIQLFASVIHAQPFTLDDIAGFTNTDNLHEMGLAGEGKTIYIFEKGPPRLTHEQFFNGRAVFKSKHPLTLSDENMNHATLVGGVILCRDEQKRRPGGMAYKAKGIFVLSTDDLDDEYLQSPDLLISNHSYGDQACCVDNNLFGTYSDDSRRFDSAMYKHPYWLPVAAAGNYGEYLNLYPMQPGYDRLPPDLTTAKNSLTVANGNAIVRNEIFEDVEIYRTSSQGPTDDLRIKPEITGIGTDVISGSAEADDYYKPATGTSVAAPNISGSLLLLQEYFEKKNKRYMRAATLKGLVMHTATFIQADDGIIGPNAKAGYGLLDAGFAAETITRNGERSIIAEARLDQGKNYQVKVPSLGLLPLKVSICWTDPAGNPITFIPINSTIPALNNDLDLRVTDPLGNTCKPYVLKTAFSYSLDDNKVDPFERIDILQTTKGYYTIDISHKGVLMNGAQDFSLIITWIEDAEQCLQTIKITDAITERADIRAGNIESSADINTNKANITYAAGINIIFTAGTYIHGNKDFTGLTADCQEVIMPSQAQVKHSSLPEKAIAKKETPSVELLTDGVSIYPNPSHGVIRVRNHRSEIKKIELFDINGRLLQRQFYNSKEVQLELKNRVPGIYIIVICSEDGSIINKKLVQSS